MPGATRWSRKVIEWLHENREVNLSILIPFLFLMIDLLLRASLHLDLIDSGADMALLAVSIFVFALMQDIQGESPDDNVEIEVLFLLWFILLWLICLLFASDLNPILKLFPGLVYIRLYIVMSTGLMALILASVFLSELKRA